jgi:N-methylhydantoinase B/oxoprolinase/acetone carboxylase alpha subunit
MKGYPVADFYSARSRAIRPPQWCIFAPPLRVKIGARMVRHGRHIIFQLAKVAVSGRMFGLILAPIVRLRLIWADGTVEVFPSKFLITVKKGGVLTVNIASRGGFGNLLDWDLALPLRDVVERNVTVGHAAEAYGVVIVGEPLRVDEASSVQLRAERQA